MNPEVDAFIKQEAKWQQEMQQLRSILLDCGLEEALKWKAPCYSCQGNNIAILGGFKEYCVLSFFKGVLLKDEHNILVKPGANTQSARMIKFTSTDEIKKITAILKAYIQEAIEAEKAGLKVDFKEKNELIFPDELQKQFSKDITFKAAFEALTPGKQRAYILHFTQPKQSKTRASRIEKCKQRILDGIGLNEW